jgi:outer membrane protein assembly factor BamB
MPMFNAQSARRFPATALAIAIGTFLASTATAQSDWPAFRGADGQGVSRAKAPPPVEWSDAKHVEWKIAMPGPGTSSPVVFGDRIYITCFTGYNTTGREEGQQQDLRRHLIALRRDNGATLWDKPLPAKLPEQARIRDGHGYASSTPAVDKDRIYCFYGKTGVVAFDHAGKQLWQADVGDGLSGWGSAASPVLHDGMVIINASVESESLIALDQKTGRKLWSARGIKESWNTPIVVPVKTGAGVKHEVVVAIHGAVLGFDAKTGEQLWSCKTDIPWYMVPSLVSHEGIVYAIGGRGGGGALAVRAGGRGDVTGSHRLWMTKKGSNVSSPIYHDGHLYWMNDSEPIAYCAKADTGEIVYANPISRFGQVYGSPVLAGGNIYYTSRDGRTVVVAARPQFEQLAINSLEQRGMFNSSPAVVDGKLLIRSDKYLYCLSEK